MKSLNIIGAGRVGMTLGHLFVRYEVFDILQILNTQKDRSLLASAFIAQGEAITDFHSLKQADVTLLCVPDDAFGPVVDSLIEVNALKRGSILFHCSGAKSSQDLMEQNPALLTLELEVASVHPVRSFADPRIAAEAFKDTICSVEGSDLAQTVLIAAFEKIGAKVIRITADHKLLYHAGSVFASNYLVTLMDTAIAAYRAAGIEADMASQMAHSLALGSLNNVNKIGTSAALTGPIKRGDMQTVINQAAQVSAWNQDQGQLYQAFIQPTLNLAKRSTPSEQ